jgi:pyruvate kinase
VLPNEAPEIGDLDSIVLHAETLLLARRMVEPGDWICLVAGTPFGVRGKTDLIKLHRIGSPAVKSGLVH